MWLLESAMAYLGERQQQQGLPQPPASWHPRSRSAPGASPRDQPQEQGVTTSCCLPGALSVAPHSFTKQQKKSKYMSSAHAPERSCWRDQVLLPCIFTRPESCLLLQFSAAAAALAGPPPHRALSRTVESPLHLRPCNNGVHNMHPAQLQRVSLCGPPDSEEPSCLAAAAVGGTVLFRSPPVAMNSSS